MSWRDEVKTKAAQTLANTIMEEDKVLRIARLNRFEETVASHVAKRKMKSKAYVARQKLEIDQALANGAGLWGLPTRNATQQRLVDSLRYRSERGGSFGKWEESYREGDENYGE